MSPLLQLRTAGSPEGAWWFRKPVGTHIKPLFLEFQQLARSSVIQAGRMRREVALA